MQNSTIYNKNQKKDFKQKPKRILSAPPAIADPIAYDKVLKSSLNSTKATGALMNNIIIPNIQRNLTSFPLINPAIE